MAPRISAPRRRAEAAAVGGAGFSGGRMQQETSMAILFADVSESMALYEQLGDAAARAAIGHCIELMSDATRGQGGTVVKTMGDEVMSVFSSVDAAAAAAVDMQEHISGAMEVEGRRITVRIGFHHGPALVEGGDVFGDAVNLAARMAKQAKSEQIVTTEQAVERMSDAWRLVTRKIDRAAVRGRREHLDLYEVVWRFEAATWVGQGEWESDAPACRGCLVLSHEGRRIELGEASGPVVVGRAPQADLVVDDGMVSRLHATIELRNGRFVLTDRSINGTYLVGADGASAFIRRDSRELHGSGILSFGRMPAASEARPVRFEVLE